VDSLERLVLREEVVQQVELEQLVLREEVGQQVLAARRV
jgi:hypothetical protein